MLPRGLIALRYQLIGKATRVCGDLTRLQWRRWRLWFFSSRRCGRGVCGRRDRTSGRSGRSRLLLLKSTLLLQCSRGREGSLRIASCRKYCGLRRGDLLLRRELLLRGLNLLVFVLWRKSENG